MMEIRNLTPHAIHVLGEDSQVVLTLPASGVVARAATSRSCVGAVDVDGVAVPVNATSFGDVTGLPDPQPGVAFVVSGTRTAESSAAAPSPASSGGVPKDLLQQEKVFPVC